MANIKLHDASENERFLGWSWEVFETLSNGGVNVIDEGDCRFHFLVDIPSDFPGQFTGQPETLLTDRRFKHGTERTISNRYYNQYRYLSAWHIRNGTKANQGSFNRFYNNIFRWKSSQTNDINDFGAWENFAVDNSLADTALPAGYPGFETAVVYEQGNGTLGLPYNMGADAGSYNNLDHDYPPYKYHCDASNLTDVHDIAKYLDRTNTETAATVMTNANLPTDMFNLAWTLDGSTGKPSASAEAESWIRSRLQIEQYDITYKTYWGLPTVEDQGEVTWIIKNVTPQHLYDPTHIGTYPEPYLYAYILTPTKIRPVKLGPSAYNRGASLAYNYPSTSLSPGPEGIHFFNNNDEVLFGEKVPWCGGTSSGGTSSGGTSSDYRVTVNFANCDHWHWSLNGGAESRVMTGNTADITAVDGTNTLVVKGVDANHAQLATDTHTFLNIITTNLDLPDEPEPDEFKGNDPFSNPAAYEWYDYADDSGTGSYYPGDSHTTYRGSWVRYKLDSTESAVNNFEAYDDAYMRHNVVFEEEPSGTDDIYVHLTRGHSIFGANRRYYTKRIIDLWFTDGVYAPMSDDLIGGGNYFQSPHTFLTQRIGNESEYAVSLPVYKEDGTKVRDLQVFDTFPPPDNAAYRMTFDGFDMDLWQHGTTMRPGFKNPQAPNIYRLSDLGRNANYYTSETLSRTGKFFEDPTNGYGVQGGKEFAAMENYDHLALDGYMYYKGELKMTGSEALAENPDLSYNARNSFNEDSLTDENAIWTRNGSSSRYRTFRRTVARKALSSDHTVQTVIDALKERRSNRTVTGVMAHNGYHTMHIDGAVKKFQSGEWYYPSNSQMSGKNYSAITATAPYFAENLQGYYYAKNFTIGST